MYSKNYIQIQISSGSSKDQYEFPALTRKNYIMKIINLYAMDLMSLIQQINQSNGVTNHVYSQSFSELFEASYSTLNRKL